MQDSVQMSNINEGKDSNTMSDDKEKINKTNESNKEIKEKVLPG